LNDLVSNIQEDRIAYRDGQRYVARFSPMALSAGETLDDMPIHLEIPASHVLEDLTFQPLSRRNPSEGEVEIRVMATGLNFRDVLKTLGMYPGPVGPLGDECAGEITAVGPGVTDFTIGDRVVGVASGTFDSYVSARQDLLVPLADNISYEDAAGVPIAFLTAYYALHHLANLQAGQRVLIHAAAGGVGLAAVQLALLAGAEVIGTAGSPEKRDFLKSLGVQHVFNSRTLDFADEIMKVTNGEGVDIVLNSLAGEFIPKSLSLLQRGGSFLEIGKTGIWDREQVAILNPNIAYHIIFLGEQFETEPALIHSMLAEIMDAIASGRLQLLPKQVFPVSDIASAFRYMAQAKHIGKIVITRQTAQKPIYGDATYLITGGLSGVGLEVAQWLPSQGARSLILMGRRAASEPAQAIIESLRGNGIQVSVAQGDAASVDDVQRIIEASAADLPPLRGIFHSAGVNDDGLLLNLDETRFEKVMNAKVTGTWNLHTFTQHLPLDHFVLFSSIAANMGSLGQANYAAANAFMDGMANWRQAQGLPGLSINWGPWENLGMTAVLSSADVERLRRQGMHGLTSQQAMSALAQLLTEDVAQATVLHMDWKAFGLAQKDQSPAPFFDQLVSRDVVTPAKKVEKTQDGALIPQLRELPIIQRRRSLLNHIREQAGIVMGLSPSVLSDVRQPFNSMGLDSLMAVELRNALVRSTGESLPATLIFDYPTLDLLTDHILNDVLKLGEVSLVTPEPVQATQSIESNEVASLTDDEAEALLLEELMKPKKKG
jgi:NADPH:quinone reductase-like Zn-dependent oxidoreductase